MWPFSSRSCKYKTLSHAVRAGDIRATRKMLNQGADPNKVDLNDDQHPLFYALNHGPEMVQLLIDHGADVNIPSPRRLHVMPLAIAEARGQAYRDRGDSSERGRKSTDRKGRVHHGPSF